MNQQVDALVHGAPVHSSIDKTQGDGRGVTHLGVFRTMAGISHQLSDLSKMKNS
jgi:hypothetical protein